MSCLTIPFGGNHNKVSHPHFPFPASPPILVLLCVTSCGIGICEYNRLCFQWQSVLNLFSLTYLNNNKPIFKYLNRCWTVYILYFFLWLLSLIQLLGKSIRFFQIVKYICLIMIFPSFLSIGFIVMLLPFPLILVICIFPMSLPSFIL